jgi:hypothetical protein
VWHVDSQQVVLFSNAGKLNSEQRTGFVIKGKLHFSINDRIGIMLEVLIQVAPVNQIILREHRQIHLIVAFVEDRPERLLDDSPLPT